MSDKETLSAYDAEAKDYLRKLVADTDKTQDKGYQEFTVHLPKGGRVLDLGCGPGQYAAAFRDDGYQVEATDASPEMARIAQEKFGVKVRVETFDALEAQDPYDGVWANFSLLHAPKAEFPNHLARIVASLKPGGTLLLGMKLGEGEKRDSLGRFYSYFTEEELTKMLTDAGMTIATSRKGEGKGLTGAVDPFIVIVSKKAVAS